MDYNTIMDKIKNEEYSSKVAYPQSKRYRADTIIDEEKSVRWNREEVERRNEQRKKDLEEYRNATYKGESEFKQDVINFAIENGLNKSQAEIIVDKAWSESHSEGLHSVFITADELVDFVIGMIDLI